MLEKASWVLESSRGKIRFAIVIKLVNRTAKEVKGEDEGQEQNRVRGSGKRSLDGLSSSPPRTIPKRVRSVQIQRANLGDSEPVAAAALPYSESSSELRSVSSADSTYSMPSSNQNIYLVALPVEQVTPGQYHLDDSWVRSSPPPTDSPPGSPAPPSSPALPILRRTHNPRGTFSRALVTVLGLVLVGNHRKATTILDSIEFWPTASRP